MPDEREDEPKIRIVDRRMLSEDERTGNTSDTSDTSTPPKLEIVGGFTSQDAPQDEGDEPDEEAGTLLSGDFRGEVGDDDDAPLSDEEAEQMRSEIETEQFAAIEQQMGRPLTETEKNQVREEMDRQAQVMASMAVAPVLVQSLLPLMEAMPRYASVHLGLMPNPYTRLIARNDGEARAAIDAFAAALDLVKDYLDAASRRECARVLNDLRVNYASITGAQPGGGRIIH